MTDSVIIALIINISGMLGMFGKSWIDKRNTDRAITNRDKLQNIAVKEIQDTLVRYGMDVSEVKIMLENHISDNDFMLKFKNTLQNKSSLILTMYGNLDKEHRNILGFWAESIEKFGLKFYYSTHRKGNKIELSKFLNTDMDIKIDSLSSLISRSLPKPKQLKGKPAYFNNFIHDTQIHNSTQLLVLKLVENGLTFESTISLFENYLAEYYRLYLDKMVQFELLPEMEYKDV